MVMHLKVCAPQGDFPLEYTQEDILTISLATNSRGLEYSDDGVPCVS